MMKKRIRPFRNNYPAAIMVLVILLSSFAVNAQVRDGLHHTPIIPPYSWKSGWFKVNLSIPDSIASSGIGRGSIYFDTITKSAVINDGLTWIYQRGVDSIWIVDGGLDADTVRYRSLGTTYTAGLIAGGSGSGSVTDFTSGNLSPLFTSSVATSTTTPAITFSLSNTDQYKVFGRVASGTGVPSFIDLDTTFIPNFYTKVRSLLSLQTVTDIGSTTTNQLRHTSADGYSRMFNDAGEPYFLAFRTAGSLSGMLQPYRLLFSNASFYSEIMPPATFTANRTHRMPDTSGVLVAAIMLNGTRYNPTVLGTVDLGTIAAGIPTDTSVSINNRINLKQDILVSGTNIKTVNSNSIVGSGNLTADQLLTSQTGNAGKYLKTDGTNATWQTVSVSVDSGTLASRPGSPTFGQRYRQTNELAGWYTWNGTYWEHEKPYEMIVDFTFPVRAYNTATGITLVASGGGDWRSETGYQTQIGGTLSSPNFWFYTAASTASSGYRFGAGSSLETFRMGDSSYVIHQKIFIPFLSDATDTYIFRVGSNSGNGSSDGTGMFFKYTHGTNSGNWQCLTTLSGSTTTINTSTAVSAMTAYDLVITYYNDSKVDFFINGTFVGQSTTNISPAMLDVGAWLTRSAGTGVRAFFADRLKIYRF